MEEIRHPLPWIHDHHEDGEDEHEEPEVHEEEVAAPVDDLDDDGDEGVGNADYAVADANNGDAAWQWRGRCWW